MSEEFHDKQFSIRATIDSTAQLIQVITAETTDGIAFFKCSVGENELTWLRKEVDQWEQVWGNLNQEEVQLIGQLIDLKLEEEKAGF